MRSLFLDTDGKPWVVTDGVTTQPASTAAATAAVRR
jgi:hypothetical protein